MVISTELTKKDHEQIDSIYRKHHASDFYIPSLRNSITHACVKVHDKVVAFGTVNAYPEAILVLDYDASLREKSVAWRLLLNKAIQDTAKQSDQLYVTVHTEAHLNLLQKHYGFKDVIGKQLYLEL